MKDLFGREVDTMRISVIDRCNMRCTYCMPRAGIPFMPTKDLMSDEQILEVMRAAISLGVNRFRVTGGEPLVRKGLMGLMRKMRALDGISQLSITSNAVLLDKYLDDLADIGIDSINVSLDTLDPEKFAKITRLGDFSTVWAAIERALEMDFCTIKLNAVLMKSVNDDEIIDFARLSLKHKLHVRFIEFMPSGDWEAKNKYFLSGDHVIEQISSLAEFKIEDNLHLPGPAYYLQVDGAPGSVGLITPVSKPFCSNCRRLRLTADGYLRGCLLEDGQKSVKECFDAGASYEELQGLISNVIGHKPEKHDASRSINMSYVGG